jgi:hypothetical protein
MTSPISIINSNIADALRSQGKNVVSKFEWTPFQQQVLLRDEFEIGLFGGKFGGKTHAAQGFLLKGNPDIENVDENGQSLLDVNLSYVYHPNYRATILRRNQNDLDDFLRKFEAMAQPLGGKYTRGLFEFPSCAVIACGHLADKDAWMKYIGVENVRFVVEEAALIPDFDLYDQIRSCCRSVWPEMRPQILLTSNAGGPGTGWINDRFVNAKDKDGNKIPPGTTIHEIVEHEEIRVDKTRIYLKSTYRDNPHALNDPGYIGTLATIRDDKTRLAYLEGDWDTLSGVYFSIFREKGPLLGEPSHANHIIPADPSRLDYYWHRFGAIDVGSAHETSILWGCQDPATKQTHIYRELVADHTSYIQLGFELASRSMLELERLPSHSMTFWISHDALHNKTGTDGKSIAELFMDGIARKLGPQAVHFPEFTVKQFRELASGQYLHTGEDDKKWADMLAKLKSHRAAGITLRVAPNDRVIGWQYCLESLRFTPVGELLPPFSDELAGRLYQQDPLRHEEYMRLYRNQFVEVLPRIQFWQASPDLGPLWGCPRLIQAIPLARHAEGPGKNPEDIDKTHFKGMDSLDSWRYLMMGQQETVVEEPFESYRNRQVAAFRVANPHADANDLVWINRGLEAQWEEERRGQLGIFTMPRKSMVRRMGGPEAFAQQVGRLMRGGRN